jgi:hypothetical protein
LVIDGRQDALIFWPERIYLPSSTSTIPIGVA